MRKMFVVPAVLFGHYDVKVRIGEHIWVHRTNVWDPDVKVIAYKPIMQRCRILDIGFAGGSEPTGLQLEGSKGERVEVRIDQGIPFPAVEGCYRGTYRA
jgi:hypothetical protein